MEERKLDPEKQIERLVESISWIDSECVKMDNDKKPDLLRYPELLKKRMEAVKLLEQYKKELEREKQKIENEPINEEDRLSHHIYRKGNETYTYVRASYIRLKDN